MRSIEFDSVSVSFPSARIPSMKEWIVRKATGRGHIDWFPALTDVSMAIDSGECLGVVGANGAGKSTLLRVAAGVLVPSAGSATIRGAVAPLIELGTGFDGELSGRENIFFNGALLGRSRQQMQDRAEEIVEFSGLQDFLDLPLRTYSTGMVARLAFSIATAVDANVVLLDEILSVGDAAFQRKCEDRILGFRERGATILLVSHDLGSIEKLCDRAVWLHEGRIRATGSPSEIIRMYSEAGVDHGLRHNRTAPPTDITVDARKWSSTVSSRESERVAAVFASADATGFDQQYARQITERIVVAGGATQVVEANLDEGVGACMRDVRTEYVLFLTDHALMPSPNLVAALVDVLDTLPDVDAAVPVANESKDERQSVQAAPYLTLRQFEEVTRRIASEASGPRVVEWSSVDPGACLLRRAAFASDTRILAEAIAGKNVAIVPSAFVHRFIDFARVLRTDLLERIPLDARSVLEIGCGAGLLARELGRRQSCRIVGVERTVGAAKGAREHLERLLIGPPEGIIDALQEEFDAIVLHESFEGIPNPWALLRRIRTIAAPGATLLMSLHNVASWPIVADLLRGRFDYVYAGHLAAENLRFFTERSIREMLELAGWKVVSIDPQPQFEGDELHRLKEALIEGGVEFSAESLAIHGYYVIAENQT